MAQVIKRSCRDYEKMIPDFLKNGLTDEDMLDFYAHMLGCNSCKDELSIQYMVKAGFEDNDENNYNLMNRLNNELDSHFKEIVLKRSVLFGAKIIAVGTLLVIILSIII